MIVVIKQFYKFFRNTFYVLRAESVKWFVAKGISSLKDLYNKFCSEFLHINKKVRNLVDTNIELGLYHFYKGNKGDACLRFWLLKISAPSVSYLVYYNLGRCYLADDKTKKAKKYFNKAIQIKEYYPEVRYCLDKIEDPKSITKIPLSIIEERFDYTAPYYVRERIVNKQYNGHKIVFHEIIGYLHNRSTDVSILDIGCGSGICGHFLKMNHVGDNITGIDLSSKMLRVAEHCYVDDKAVYDKLLHTSSSQYFANSDAKEKFDIILTVDSLGCEKELYNTFCLYRDALKKGGVIVSIVRSSGSNNVQFLPNLDMFCYSQDYMLHLSSQLDMESFRVIKCQLYTDVDGYLCMFAKK